MIRKEKGFKISSFTEFKYSVDKVELEWEFETRCPALGWFSGEKKVIAPLFL